MKNQAIGRKRNKEKVNLVMEKRLEQNKIRNVSGNTKAARVQDSCVVKASEKNCFLRAEENAEQPPGKRSRGMDGKLANTSLQSPEKGLLLRPRKLVPSFQKVELNESDFQRILGKRVRVYWPDSRRWFIGQIKSFDSKKKLHKIVYDDGDKEDLDLKGERFELEVMPTEAFVLLSKLRTPIKTADIHNEHHEQGVSNYYLPEEGTVEKSSKKRKTGVDNDTSKTFPLSSEISLSKLRPRKVVPLFQKVELNDNDFERIVGKRVKVYWPDSRRWFVGRIKSYDSEKKLHNILYNDGDKEDLNLKSERFELEVMSSEAFNICSKNGLSLQKKGPRSDCAEVMNEANGSSVELNAVRQVKRNTRTNKKQIIEATREGNIQCKGGKITEQNTVGLVRNIASDVHTLNSEDKVTTENVIDVDNRKNAVGQVKENTRMNKKQVKKATRKGNFERKVGMITQQNTVEMGRDIARDVHTLNIEDKAIVEDVTDVDNPENVEVKDDLEMTESLSEVVSKINQKFNEVLTTNPKSNSKQTKTKQSREVSRDKDVKEDPAKNDAKKKMKKKVVKKNSRLRAGKSSKEEKAEKLFPSNKPDVIPENVEKRAEGNGSEIIPVNAVFGNSDEAS